MGKPFRLAKPAEADESPEDTPLLDVAADQIKPEKTDWFWTDRLEWGTVALMQGEKGAGKSTWLRTLAADVTGGPRLPGLRGKRRVLGNVLYYAGEESLKKKVRPSLEAVGADMKRCFVSDAFADDPALQLQLPGDCDRLKRRIEVREARLVIIDPVFCFLDGTCDLEGPTQPARYFMRLMGKIAEQTGALILLSRNLTKDRTRGALSAGRGSAELANAARSVLHLQCLPDDKNVFGMAVAACNAGSPVPTLTYRLAPNASHFCTVELVGETGASADDLVAGEEGDLDRCMLDRAKALIRSLIPSGKLDSRVVKSKAENAMISTRTLQSAAKALGVRMTREGSREATTTYWSPPARGWGG